eukprot:178411_1
MPTALCIFTLYLIIACIQTQRVTIYSWPFTSSTSGWHLDLTSSDSKLVTNTQCPGASSCYRLTNDDEFYIYVDTRTYTDIQIGYDIRSSGLDSSGDDYCEFWWMIGTATAANWEQSWIPQAQHFANDNPQSILHTSLPSDVDDYYSIGIDFWANMETSEYCYLNNVIVTGIPEFTMSPTTFAPTQPSTPPTSAPTAAPTVKTEFPTSPPSNTPSISPSRAPSHAPSTAPTINPTPAPTATPTGNTASPTSTPSRAPSSTPTLTPTVPPTLAPTLNPSLSPSAAPTKITASPTSAPSSTPSSPPTRAPTSNPTAPPSNSPSISPSRAPSLSPTPSPTPHATLVDDIWTDDFIFNGVDGFGWYQDDTAYHNLYHGPYFEGTYWLSRWFQCTTYSSVTIQYMFQCCTTNDHADVTVYINNDRMDKQVSDSFPRSGFPYTKDCADDWREHLVDENDIGSVIMTKHDAFYVAFRIRSEHGNDGVGMSNITVICGPAISNSPTPEPTNPTTDPTNAPSISPTRYPTNTPTLPSADPTLAPTFSPTSTPTAAPTGMTASPTSAPSRVPSSAPTLTPSVAPSLAPTLNPSLSPSSAPTGITASPTSAPSRAPSSSPTRAPTDNPTSSPSSAPSSPPSRAPSRAPTPAPTPRATLIDDIWTDDFVFNGVDGFGWSDDDTVYQNLYHGPYVEGTYWLSRWFQCKTYSTVTIEYKFQYCRDNDHGDITVYINDVWMDFQASYWFSTKSAFPDHNECRYAWRELLVGEDKIGSVVVTKHEAFYVHFRMRSDHDTDPVGLSDVKVICGPAISNSPTPEPTTPTTNPTNAPSIAPTRFPTNTPTLPSLDPTLAPTISPTSTPTTTPTGITASPTSAPSRAPSCAPTHAPTSTPTLPPTNAPTSAPSAAPTGTTASPTSAPSNAPSSPPTHAPTHNPTSAPSNTPSNSPTQPPSLSPTPAPTPHATLIDDIWTDDFIFNGVNGFGWSNDDTVYQNLYHGPYVEGTYWLSRWFQCKTYSTVTIEYKFQYCRDNDHGDITVYINGVWMDKQNAYWFSTKSSFPDYNECRYPWRELLVGEDKIGSVVMTKHEAFYVRFRMRSDHDTDPVGLSDVKVICGPAISNSPTQEPTNPTTNPTNAPSMSPTRYPTNAPTLPSQDPTPAPTISPTSAPTDTPTAKTVSPSFAPT